MSPQQSTTKQITTLSPPTRGPLQDGEGETVPLNQIAAPYAVNNADDVNMSTGEVTYQNIDVVIPGRNGLDLVIGRRYNSSNANLHNPEFLRNHSGIDVDWLNSTTPVLHAVVWDTYFYPTGGNGGFTINTNDQGPYAEIFTSSDILSGEYYRFLSDLKDLERRPVNVGSSGTLWTYVLYDGPFQVDYYYYNGNRRAYYEAYESAKKENSHMFDLYGLGNGWGFMFSSIETIDSRVQTQILHLNDGRSFQINSTFVSGSSNLKNYTLTDLRLMKESGGYVGATYTLYYKDGKKEHFDVQGRLIAIRDRYNNTITLTHSKQNNLPRIVITDTLGRTTTISGASISGGHRMIVTLPDGRSLKYTVEKLPDLYTVEKTYVGTKMNRVPDLYNSTQKGYALAMYQNQLDVATSYSYNLNSSRYNFMAYSSSDLNYGYTQAYTEDDKNIICTGSDTYTLYLKSISHPTNYRTDYTYINRTRSLGASGVMASYIPRFRDQVLNNAIYNRIRYYWDGSDYTGYPNGYNPDNLPSYFTYWNGYTSHGGASSSDPIIGEDFIYNNKHLLVKQIHSGDSFYYHIIKSFVYNADKLPVEITTKTYNPFFGGYDPFTGIGIEPSHRTAIEAFQYDNKSNITAYWSPKAKGNTTNTEYKTMFTFDATYCLPLTKTYKQDANTTIIIQNTISGPNIIRSEVLVNNATKSKTEYVYGNGSYPGNITAERKYKDGLSTYVQTDYAYQSNAYLSEIKNTGILDPEGNLATPTPLQPAGTILSKMAYDTMGRLTQVTDASNFSTNYAYNYAGDMTTQTNPDSTTVTYTRNYNANTLTVKDENGTNIRYDYTPFGQDFEVRDVQSGTVLSRKIHDNLFRLQSETDLLNSATTTYAYDNVSRLASKTTRDSFNAIIAQETYDYYEGSSDSEPSGGGGEEIIVLGDDQWIQKTVVGEANAPSIVTRQYFNIMGWVSEESRKLNGTEYYDRYVYDYLGNRTKEYPAYRSGLYPYNYSYEWEYDYAGRITKTNNVDNEYTTNTYNALGQLTSATDYAGTATTYIYDGIGRLLEENSPIEQIGGTVYNAVKRNYYDSASNISSNYKSNNQVSSTVTWAHTDYDYNSRGRLEYVTQYDGVAIDNVTKYTYDDTGNLLTMRVGMSGKAANDGQQTTYTYDRLGRMLALTDPLSQQETYSYKNGGLGLLNTKTDRNGNMTSYSYDALGRVLSEQVATPENVTELNSYTYYLTGAMKTQSNPTVSTTFAYDGLGRLTKETDVDGGVSTVKQYAYDIADNRLSFTATVGGTQVHNTSYTYDSQNRQKTVSDNGSLKATYNYNTNGARESLVYTNGTSEHFTYNLANWLTHVENRTGSTVVSAYDYTYFADGNQHTKTDQDNRITTYSYDGAGRLASEGESTGFGAAYTYDRFSNRATMAVTGAENYTVGYSYDANNRLLQDVKTTGNTITTGNYFYDPNGNQIAKASESLTPSVNGTEQVGIDPVGVELYEYDGRDRLVWTLHNGEEVIYNYRADGLRNSKGSSSGTVTHLWDGANIVADMSGSTVIARYVRGINLLLSDNGAGSRFYLYNGHGDVVQLANSSGAVVKDYDFDAFGNERNPDPADANPFRYCAEYFDKETGTVYLRTRYYSPVLGRFTQQDGWGFWEPNDPLSLNLYIYSANNPIMYIDPSGCTFRDSMQGLRDALDEDMFGGAILWTIDKITGYKHGYSFVSEYDYYLGRTIGDVISGLLGVGMTAGAIMGIISSIVAGGAITVGSGGTLVAGGVAIGTAGVAAGTAVVAYGATVVAMSASNFSSDYNKVTELGKTEYKKPVSGSGKEKATDVPSWAKGNKPFKAENGNDFATRLMNDKYGKGNWKTSSSEFSKIKKWGDRGFI